ncbi:phosphoglycerate dehydrogenase [Arcanobacterium hippocoleae]
MNRHKIALLNNIADAGITALGKNCITSDSIENAVGVLVRSANMHELEFPQSLRAIARAGAGTNNIPLERATENGIAVFNTPGANANAVKEIVLCAMLIAARNIIGGVQWVKEISTSPTLTKDVEEGKKAFAGNELSGKVLGIIGLGAIGSRVAHAALALGMQVIGFDPYLTAQMEERLPAKMKYTAKIEKIFAQSDYITLHVPFTAETANLIDADVLTAAKPGAVVMNFARDGLIDEQAIEKALNSGIISQYITDLPNTRNINMKGCIAIPHLGASTAESEENCAIMAAQELVDYLENGNITNSVNLPNCSLGPLKDPARICVMHKNVPNMLAAITSVLGTHNININDMSHRSRGNIAYVLLDVDESADETITEKISQIDGVVRVRVLQ